MIAPLSWLKEYVDITLTPKELGDKLTEVGLGCEKIEKVENDTIFHFEITPNRPDCLSIIGIAREIGAITSKKIKLPKIISLSKPKKILPLTIKTNSKINPRFTGIIIDGVKVGESPKWLKDRLQSVGQRPINNIVDITNYVMQETGNPLHAFDYDKIMGHTIVVSQTKGGEKFESVDEISYHLPKDAVVISDKEKIIDLCGIKGGKNSGAFNATKTIFIRVPVEIPQLIRRTSLSLGIRSEASSIFERGVNTGGTIDTLKRASNLILEIAGGEVASDLYDIKDELFNPWKLNLRLERMSKILGIEIPEKRVLEILTYLNLSPKLKTKNIIETTIPTYRNDLKIEEDLIEEVARLYGYNNFPKTLPTGEIPTKTIPYAKDYLLDQKIKELLKANGFSEIYTYGLVSENDLKSVGADPDKTLRVDNPISREFEYLRPTLAIGLTKAVTQNRPSFEEVNLFEMGKVYLGANLDSAKEEVSIAAVSSKKNFFEIKGLLERVFNDLGIKDDPTKFIKVLDEGIFFELSFEEVRKKINPHKTFKPLPKYPPIIEDLAIVANESVSTNEILNDIKKQSNLIVSTSLLDQFENTRTFHIIYQHKERNLKKEEVSQIREGILKGLKEKFNAELKK